MMIAPLFAPLISIVPFATVMSITPGPNNLMVTASGANFGFRRTLPHMAGVVIGFPLLLLAIGTGLGQIFAHYPLFQVILKTLGIGYILWMAWKMAMTKALHQTATKARPVSFLEAALFQWINPKAWLMGIAMMSSYAAYIAASPMNMIAMCALMGLMSAVAVVIWCAFGTLIAHKLESARAFRLFNLTMAAAMVLSLIPMIQA